MWTIRDINKAINADPDRLITFKAWINFKKNLNEIKEITVYEIPYIF